MQVQNSAGEDTRTGVYVSSSNEEDLSGSKGTCNFQVKWVRDAKASAHITVVQTIKGKTMRKVTESGEWAPLVGFECRGLNPVAFHPENGWQAVSLQGTRFEDVDLSEDWADYCEKGACSVGIYQLESRFVRG